LQIASLAIIQVSGSYCVGFCSRFVVLTLAHATADINRTWNPILGL